MSCGPGSKLVESPNFLEGFDIGGILESTGALGLDKIVQADQRNLHSTHDRSDKMEAIASGG